jgi:hypothetical protein
MVYTYMYASKMILNIFKDIFEIVTGSAKIPASGHSKIRETATCNSTRWTKAEKTNFAMMKSKIMNLN